MIYALYFHVFYVLSILTMRLILQPGKSDMQRLRQLIHPISSIIPSETTPNKHLS